MTRSAIAALAVVVLALVGCGDDDGGDGDAATSSTSAASTPPAATEIDCDAMMDAQFELSFSNQYLASLVSNAQFELIDDGTIDVDFDAIREAIAVLRPLDEVDNPLGSVDESLDRLDRVAALAAEAAASDDPESTEAFAEIQTIIADDAAFIGGMGPVNYAYGEACQT